MDNLMIIYIILILLSQYSLLGSW